MLIGLESVNTGNRLQPVSWGDEMRESKPKVVFCVAKSVSLRNEEGEVVHSLTFGAPFKVLEQTDGKYYGETIRTDYNGRNGPYLKYRGWAPIVGFSRNKVKDMANLIFMNKTGKRVPVAMRYKGSNQTGWIKPSECVQVAAVVGEWMLTEKGWTKSEWLKKVRDVDDAESIRTLVYAVILQTVKDYQHIIHRLQMGQRFAKGEIKDALTELRLIREWFRNGDYLKIVNDDLTGLERLKMIDDELGVSEQWVKQMMSKKNVP